MEEWLVAEQRRGGGSVANSRFRIGRRSTSSKALTPLRGLGRPQTSLQAGSDARRSKSADPMSLSKALPPTDTRSHGRTGRSNTASPGLLDSEVPLSRTKVLPLVSNRADREQVQDFYSELRQAAEAGRLRFEEGVQEREQQRQTYRANQSRVLITGEVVSEPLSYAQFLEQIDQLNIVLCSVEDEYDSDELEDTRTKVFEEMRLGWHFSRSAIPRDQKKPRAKDAPTENNPAVVSRALSSQGSFRNASSPASSTTDIPTNRRKQSKDISAMNIKSAAIKQNADVMKAFGVMNIHPHPSEVDLRGRRDIVTPQNMEALVEIFEEVAGLVPPHDLLMSNCLIGGLGIDLMAPYLK